MQQKIIVAGLLLLVTVPTVRADGCKFASDGRKVPEREQRAFVEWTGGTETLYVGALSDPTTEGTVWIVPVRAPAEQVRAEPIDALPAVTYYQTLRGRTERQLREAVTLAGLMDSGGLCCPCLVGGCGGAGLPSAVEASRIEKLGMVVTVVSAESREGIQRYLEAQGVNHRAVDLSSLDSYYNGTEYAFVCGWVAKRDQPHTATGLKVVFPSSTVWFPLRPTRLYSESVETVVYVRGFVKPSSSSNLPGLTCRYIFGDVQTLSVGQTFSNGREPEYTYYPPDRLEPLTRVTLATDPQRWDYDLELVPGTTPAGTAALAVTGWVGYLGPLWSALLGTFLGLAIPWLTIPKANRRRIDWVAGAVIGGAIVLTIWGSTLVFVGWRRERFRDQPTRPRLYVVLPALAAAHFLCALVACRELNAWIQTGG